MICIYTGKLSFSPKYRSALYNLISKVTLPCWSWVKACQKLWKFRILTKYAKRFLIGTRTKICSGNKGINFKYQLEVALDWVELECEGRYKVHIFRGGVSQGWCLEHPLTDSIAQTQDRFLASHLTSQRKLLSFSIKLGSNQARELAAGDIAAQLAGALVLQTFPHVLAMFSFLYFRSLHTQRWGNCCQSSLAMFETYNAWIRQE